MATSLIEMATAGPTSDVLEPSHAQKQALVVTVAATPGKMN